MLKTDFLGLILKSCLLSNNVIFKPVYGCSEEFGTSHGRWPTLLVPQRENITKGPASKYRGLYSQTSCEQWSKLLLQSLVALLRGSKIDICIYNICIYIPKYAGVIRLYICLYLYVYGCFYKFEALFMDVLITRAAIWDLYHGH